MFIISKVLVNMLESPGQIGRQVVASGRKLNLRRDFQIHASPKKYF